MSAHASSTGRSAGHSLWTVVRFVRVVLVRLYAVALTVLICVVTYMAVRYLVNSLVRPATAPPQIVALPSRLDRAAIERDRAAFAGLDVTERPRNPLAHYHRLDSWVQPDRFNDCTRAGCHAPMPHARGKEVRAFLNMHATSLHCGVCHFALEEHPLNMLWYDLSSGRQHDAPSVLRAYELLSDPESFERLAKGDRDLASRLASLLSAAAEESHEVRALRSLAEHFAAVRTGSPQYQTLLRSAWETLPRHFRGEYGAKLAIRDPSGQGPLLAHPDTERPVRDFLRQPPAGDEERARQIERLHPMRRSAALHCTDCHRRDNGLVDFAKLGYPPARVESLVSPIIFRMIESIDSGQPFYLPGFLDGDTGHQTPPLP